MKARDFLYLGLFIGAAALLSLPRHAYAACTAPAAEAGTLQYNGDTAQMQYCNGSSWVNFPKPAASSGWKQINAGSLWQEPFACGVANNGTGWCWGTDGSGRLGNGATLTADQTTPSLIAGGHTWKTISTGNDFACGIRTDDVAMCWGSGGAGMMGNGAWSSQDAPVTVSGGHLWSKISAGAGHVCGIRTDGVAMCWGDDTTGRLGNGAGGNVNVPGIVSGGYSWSDISAGDGHTCGVTTAGIGYCWGAAAEGKLGNGTISPNVQTPSLVLGGHSWHSILADSIGHSCGLTTGNAAYCWGAAGEGRLGNGTVSPNVSSPSLVSGSHQFRSVDIGIEHSCGVTTANVGYCWGNDFYSRTGTGGEYSVPTVIQGGHSWSSVSAGGTVGCGIRTDGIAMCWGRADTGALGNGTIIPDTSVPVLVGNAVNVCTLSTWNAYTVPEANTWRDIAFGNGIFVAVAEDGTNRIMTSPDGVTWTARAAPGSSTWQSVTFGNGLFVAVAFDGTHQVMTSPDGINWTTRTGTGGQWFAVTYGNGLFVATAWWAPTNWVMTSPDGINWTGRNASINEKWLSVTYGNGLFVATAYQAAAANNIMTSPDGINWTTRNSGVSAGSNGLNGIAYGNGRFVAVSDFDVLTSTDGINWASGPWPGGYWGWDDVIYVNGRFIAVSDAAGAVVATSTDGLSWTTSASGATSGWTRLAYGSGQIVSTAVSGTSRAMTATCNSNCVNPTGPAGSIMYNQTHRVAQWCDGLMWHAAGPIGPAGPNSGCSTPTGTGGDVVFNSSAGVMQYCDGDNWRHIGAIDPCQVTGATPGTACGDGTIYAGFTPDGNVKMYTTPADAGQFDWNDNNGNYTDVGFVEYVSGETSTNALVTIDSDSVTPGVQLHEAAQYCYDLVAHGKDDWYLPARDELNVVYQNRVAIGGFNLSGSDPTGFYWSSSQSGTNAINARRQNFNTGVDDSEYKGQDSTVRCVRK